MHDFLKAGNNLYVEGGIYITDQSNSNQPKSLVQYTNEELYQEWQDRKRRLSREIKRKIKCCTVVCACVSVALCGLGVWYYVQDNTMLSSLLIGLNSIFVGLFALQYVVIDKNDVQQAHINNIGEIELILRERGAE